jgi:hypothetical protein
MLFLKVISVTRDRDPNTILIAACYEVERPTLKSASISAGNSLVVIKRNYTRVEKIDLYRLSPNSATGLCINPIWQVVRKRDRKNNRSRGWVERTFNRQGRLIQTRAIKIAKN